MDEAKQALAMLDANVANMQGTRADHERLNRAVLCIAQALEQLAALQAEPEPEDEDGEQ